MSPPIPLCLIEDDAIMGESLCDRFELEGFSVDWQRTITAALDALGRNRYAAVVSDIHLPDGSGEELFMRLLQRGDKLPPFLFITGYGAIDRAVSLLKLGAADYITKPFDLEALIDKLRSLTQADRPSQGGSAPSLGVSPAMRRIEAQLPRLAAQAHTLLITGESGVGKERVAREFHRLTPEGEAAPFVAVNCGAFPEGLLEAELFGFEKGAFTGAAKLRRGVFEQADGGTLLLDEIGDMPLSMQVKLLRVLQERQVTRLGGERAIPVRFRLVSATHQDLKKMVTQGRFREDLYYRLNVIQLHVPPLRSRREDIPWLAGQFLAEADSGKRLTQEATQALITHDWPGNVRELKHAIERGAILAEGQVVGSEVLFDQTAPEDVVATAPLSDYLGHCERSYIRKALEECQGHLGRTAAALGISRKNLWEKMKKLGLSADEAQA